MLNHLMDMKHPVSKSSANNIYDALANQSIKPDKSFDSFAPRLRLMYKTCTQSGIAYGRGYLVRCFIKGLDSNFDYSRELLSQGVLRWFNQTMNEVLISINNAKLNKETDCSWIKDTASANVTGKQGAKRPAMQPTKTITPSPQTPTMDPSIPSYLYKTSELSQKEVKHLIERYLCPFCRRNSHPLYTCYALKNTYNISLKTGPTPSTIAPSSEATISTQHTGTANANRVTNSLPMSPEIYTISLQFQDLLIF